MNELDLSKYRKDAKGNLVPVDNIKEMDLLRDELVMELAGKARSVQEKIVDFKRGAVEDIAAFVQLSADRYDVSLGGQERQCHSSQLRRAISCKSCYAGHTGL